MPRGRPLLRRLRLPFRHECTEESLRCAAAIDASVVALTLGHAIWPEATCSWCWLEDSNLPPLAYEASALPDELSQLLENRQKDRGAAPGVEATLSGAPRLGAASKSGRSRCQRARRHRRRSHRRTGSWSEDARTNARALSAHELGLDVLRLVLRAICPPASAAEGGPCAGYSGFSLELCSELFFELGTPQ